MKKSTLSLPAQQLITKYLNISVGQHTIATPYFNNKKMKVRGGLRVNIGKGDPQEIEDEIILMALRKKTDLSLLSKKEVITFVTNLNIGIECSGFVYHVMNEEMKAHKRPPLKKTMHYPIKNPIRRLIASFRPAENTNVATLNHDKNTKEIALKNVQAGDLILLMHTGKNHDLNHVLLIESVEYHKNIPKKIYYVHSLQWSTDGIHHGVRRGTIDIKNIKDPLEKQDWTEREKTTSPDNETLWRVETAKSVKIGRLNK
ncbi:hypothetical protein KKG22_01510 [Patescibacteria group bacterium]|nr:hypothetical protein [Patescibacteria group bacterium]MBU1721772.1 hypothetical protein [Patescibacteria group bacterium]MBU1901389.1 hypothetical protein [Patescibacteria group bacterium]